MTEKLFSVISPVYNVGRYLPEYFESLEAQTIGIDKLDILLIDDGSMDDSFAICQEFAQKHPTSVRAIHKENGGQGSARNLALPMTTAPWICFPDPDDVLSENFFSSICAYMSAPESQRTTMFAGHIILWDEESGRRKDNHGTSFRFQVGNSTTNLEGKPNFIHGNSVMTMFRRDVILDAGIRFEERLRTRFEDGHFIAQYLLSVDEPILGLVDEAHYYYRRRADSSSTNQTSHVDSRSYTDVPRHGWLHILEQANKQLGHTPRWLQWLILNDILWLVKVDVAAKVPSRSLSPSVLDSFFEDVRDVMHFIEPQSVLGFDILGLPLWIREAVAYGYTRDNYVGPVSIGPTDESRNLIRLSYRFKGDPPSELVFVRGRKVAPRYTKIQDLDLFGKTILKERHLWVSSLGVIRFELNGHLQRLSAEDTGGSKFKFRRSEVLAAQARLARAGIPAMFRETRVSTREWAVQPLKRAARSLRRGLQKRSVYDRLLALALRLPSIRRDYLGAWALMDRDTQANDSAEELYRWIRANEPGKKIVFVLSKSCPDWARLERDGFHLVDYGSFRWKLLMLSAAHVISSQVDLYVSDPLPVGRYGPPQWKLSFLQHGIIKGDISSWLNRKRIALFVTSTEDEYRYISGESTFKFSSKEVRLTGLPRHDALLEKSKRIPSSQVNQILIAPTWRLYLSGRIVKTSSREQNEKFMESDYAKAWQALVQSEELRDEAAKRGLKVVFMPHPNIQPYLSQFAIPEWVETRLYGDIDVQDVVGRTALMITDYSSIAFNMAYLYRPVIYYQFDKTQYESEHTEGKAYFEYETDGFGPVALDPAEVVAALASLGDDDEIAAQYLKRAERTFPVRDGKNSERVYKAISELDRPLSFSEGSTPAIPDSWNNVAAPHSLEAEGAAAR